MCCLVACIPLTYIPYNLNLASSFVAGAVLAVLGELLQQPLRSVERQARHSAEQSLLHRSFAPFRTVLGRVLRESSARRTRLKTAEEEAARDSQHVLRAGEALTLSGCQEETFVTSNIVMLVLFGPTAPC